MNEEDLKRHFEEKLGWKVTTGRSAAKWGARGGLGAIRSVGEQVSGPMFWPHLCPLTRSRGATLTPVTAGNDSGRWRKITMSVDSGAVDTVVPPNEIPGPVVPTLATQAGFVYYGADGSEIPHLGEQNVTGRTVQGREFQMRAQVAPVTKGLCAVGKMIQAGNRVVFDTQPDTVGGLDGPSCYVLHKEAGEITPIVIRDGDFQLDLYVPEDPQSAAGLEGSRQLATVRETAPAGSADTMSTFLGHV